MKKTAKKVIKSIASSTSTSDEGGIVGIQPRSKREFDWFIRALKLLTKSEVELEDGVLFDLKTPIKVKLSQIIKVKIKRPLNETEDQYEI